MFIDFITNLVLGLFVLCLFLLIASPVLGFPLLAVAATARKPLLYAVSSWLYGTLMEFLSRVILTGFIAISFRNYASHSSVEHPWAYAILGFVVAYLFNFGAGQYLAASVNHWSPPVLKGMATGAGLAFFVGFVAYPVFYTWPQVIASIPGINILFTWSRELANWLGSFSLLRIFAVLLALVFLLNHIIPILGGILGMGLMILNLLQGNMIRKVVKRIQIWRELNRYIEAFDGATELERQQLIASGITQRELETAAPPPGQDGARADGQPGGAPKIG
jgi:hypothetical protein